MPVVHLEVANLGPDPAPRIEVRAQWLGEEHSVLLTDSGIVPWDIAHDQIWVGELQGDPARVLPLQILVGPEPSSPQVLWSSIENIESEQDEFVYALEKKDGGVHISRVAAPPLGQARPDHERNRVVVLGFWTLLLYGLATVQVLRWRGG